MDFTGRRVLVLGLGATGLSMVRWLCAHGATVRIADSRDAPPSLAAIRAELPGVIVHTGRFRREVFDGVDLLAASPGVPLAEPEVAAAIARGVPVAGDVELFAQAFDALCATRGTARPPVIAITGSNGKSTVTEMAGCLCRGAGLEPLVAGNIGLPVLDALRAIEAGERPIPGAVVLELSSFQLETTASLHPDAAVVLNLSEDHLDRYAGMAEYADAKARIFIGARVAIVNREDAATLTMPPAGAPVRTFGTSRPDAVDAWGLESEGRATWLVEGGRRVMQASALRVAGRHNAANALAALALVRSAGIDGPGMTAALAAFTGLPHRVEFVAEIDGRRFYDDSKGTNVGATVAALTGMSEPVVLIAGGDGKGQDFAPLGPAAADHARAVVLIGRDRELIAVPLAAHGVRHERADDMDDAVHRAFDVSEAGDAVLLSPACASFDMFRNYEHRAQVFRAAVSHLGGHSACSPTR
jgi:UDP-N-acetylmuramoylalanine--D-glutamate ligase